MCKMLVCVVLFCAGCNTVDAVSLKAHVSAYCPLPAEADVEAVVVYKQ